MLERPTLTREDIVKIIKKSPMTDDLVYVCKKFPKLNKQCKEDKQPFIFKKTFFDNKICFTLGDIDAYLEQDSDYYNIYRMQLRDKFLKEVIKSDYKYSIKTKIKKTQYTLGELIDMAIFFFNQKH